MASRINGHTYAAYHGHAGPGPARSVAAKQRTGNEAASSATAASLILGQQSMPNVVFSDVLDELAGAEPAQNAELAVPSRPTSAMVPSGRSSVVPQSLSSSRASTPVAPLSAALPLLDGGNMHFAQALRPLGQLLVAKDANGGVAGRRPSSDVSSEGDEDELDEGFPDDVELKFVEARGAGGAPALSVAGPVRGLPGQSGVRYAQAVPSPSGDGTIAGVARQLLPYLGRGIGAVLAQLTPPALLHDSVAGAVLPADSQEPGSVGASGGVRIAKPQIVPAPTRPRGGGGQSSADSDGIERDDRLGIGGTLRVDDDAFQAAVLLLPLHRVLDSRGAGLITRALLATTEEGVTAGGGGAGAGGRQGGHLRLQGPPDTPNTLLPTIPRARFGDYFGTGGGGSGAGAGRGGGGAGSGSTRVPALPQKSEMATKWPDASWPRYHASHSCLLLEEARACIAAGAVETAGHRLAVGGRSGGDKGDGSSKSSTSYGRGDATGDREESRGQSHVVAKVQLSRLEEHRYRGVNPRAGTVETHCKVDLTLRTGRARLDLRQQYMHTRDELSGLQTRDIVLLRPMWMPLGVCLSAAGEVEGRLGTAMPPLLGMVKNKSVGEGYGGASQVEITVMMPAGTALPTIETGSSKERERDGDSASMDNTPSPAPAPTFQLVGLASVSTILQAYASMAAVAYTPLAGAILLPRIARQSIEGYARGSPLAGVPGSNNEEDFPSRPAAIPEPLYRSLCRRYDSSQLRVIFAAACGGAYRVPAVTVSPAGVIEPVFTAVSEITTVIGPPGTGKTRTVLGILSALRASACWPRLAVSGGQTTAARPPMEAQAQARAGVGGSGAPLTDSHPFPGIMKAPLPTPAPVLLQSAPHAQLKGSVGHTPAVSAGAGACLSTHLVAPSVPSAQVAPVPPPAQTRSEETEDKASVASADSAETMQLMQHAGLAQPELDEDAYRDVIEISEDEDDDDDDDEVVVLDGSDDEVPVDAGVDLKVRSKQTNKSIEARCNDKEASAPAVSIAALIRAHPAPSASALGVDTAVCHAVGGGGGSDSDSDDNMQSPRGAGIAISSGELPEVTERREALRLKRIREEAVSVGPLAVKRAKVEPSMAVQASSSTRLAGPVQTRAPPALVRAPVRAPVPLPASSIPSRHVHVLICTPSNAACDEIVARLLDLPPDPVGHAHGVGGSLSSPLGGSGGVLSSWDERHHGGLLEVTGRPFIPTVIRAGVGGARSTRPEVASVSIERHVQRRMAVLVMRLGAVAVEEGCGQGDGQGRKAPVLRYGRETAALRAQLDSIQKEIAAVKDALAASSSASIRGSEPQSSIEAQSSTMTRAAWTSRLRHLKRDESDAGSALDALRSPFGQTCTPSQADEVRVRALVEVLEGADVIATTLAGTAQLPLLHLRCDAGALACMVAGARGGGASARVRGMAPAVAVAAALRFDALIVDEAGQAVEAEVLAPLRLAYLGWPGGAGPSRGRGSATSSLAPNGTSGVRPDCACRRLILVGDPLQLPATVLSRSAAASGLDVSLFERLSGAGLTPMLLRRQYRMHSTIAAFSSAHFYRGMVQDADTIRAREVEGTTPALSGEAMEEGEERGSAPGPDPCVGAIVLADVPWGRESRRGAQGQGGQALSDPSFGNDGEAAVVAALVAHLLPMQSATHERSEERGGGGHGRGAIGVITPYKEQVRRIKAVLRAMLGANAASRVLVASVDSFQGQELDVVIISCVRSVAPGAVGGSSIGFLADSRRLNVAVTRARHSLILVCNAAHLSSADPDWSALCTHARQKGYTMTIPDPGHKRVGITAAARECCVYLARDLQRAHEVMKSNS